MALQRIWFMSRIAASRSVSAETPSPPAGASEASELVSEKSSSEAALRRLRRDVSVASSPKLAISMETSPCDDRFEVSVRSSAVSPARRCAPPPSVACAPDSACPRACPAAGSVDTAARSCSSHDGSGRAT